jgi:hypothetical protein
MSDKLAGMPRNELALPPQLARRIRVGLPRLGITWIVGGALLGGITVWLSAQLPEPDAANSLLMSALGVLPPLCLVLAGTLILPVRHYLPDDRLDLAAARRVRTQVIACCVVCAVVATTISAVIGNLTWVYMTPMAALFPSAVIPVLLCLMAAVGAASMLPPSAKVISGYS